MALFEIRWRSSVRKDIRGLPHHEVTRLLDTASQLADEPLPHGSQKLAGSERTYRIRVGDDRVIYEVLSAARIVEAQRIRHRRDAYRN